MMKRLAKSTDTVPKKPSCELLILDRSFDPVAPAIHEWTYEAMVHDVLEVKGKVYSYQIETNRGAMEEKQVLSLTTIFLRDENDANTFLTHIGYLGFLYRSS